MRPSAAGPRQATLFQAWGGRPRREAEEAEDEALAAEGAPSPSPSGFVGGPAGGVWLFPAGRVEERRYQVRAARAALEANTLLCLPTGLGKTLVAAVVLCNFHRWFPAGRALFLAPTKPLVAQQRDACARLMAIPAPRMAHLTGASFASLCSGRSRSSAAVPSVRQRLQHQAHEAKGLLLTQPGCTGALG